MKRIKAFFADKVLMKYSAFVVFTVALLCIFYFIVKNIDVLAVAGYTAVSSVLSALSPLFIGLILAYLMDPLVEIVDEKLIGKLIKLPDDPIKAEKRKNRSRFISVLITFILIISAICAILYGFAVLIVGKFVFNGFANMFDDTLQHFLNYEQSIKDWAASLPNNMLSEKIQDIAESIIDWLANNLSTSAVIDSVTSVGVSIINVVIGAILSIYLMKDKDFFISLWRKMLHLILPQKGNAVLTEAMHEVNGVLSKFIRGVMVDALIVAILSSIGLSILGLDFAVFIGVFAGIANVIPYFGPVLGMIPAFIIGFFTEGFTEGIIAVAILLLVQQIDSNFIYPKVVGSSTGLHPLFVLLAVTIAGFYGGIVGMILAVPIAGIIQVFILKWAHKKEKKELKPDEHPPTEQT